MMCPPSSTFLADVDRQAGKHPLAHSVENQHQRQARDIFDAASFAVSSGLAKRATLRLTAAKIQTIFDVETCSIHNWISIKTSHSSEEEHISVTVTLELFSGRPNPSWGLDDRQIQEFIDRIRNVTNTTLSKPPGIVGGLG
jgi:hypothetical protein